MTIPTEVGVSRYTADGATSLYNYGFKIQDDDDLEVIVTDTSDTDTTLTKTTHYTVAGVGDSGGGSITLLSPYANLTSGYSLTIRLKPALNNSTSFVDSGKVSNAQIQAAIDRLSQRCIRIQQELDRCIKLPWKETPSAAKTTIADSTDRASKALSFDSSGNPTATTSVPSGSLSASSIGTTIVEAANAGAVLDALGFTSFTKTIIDDTTAGAVQTTLGISAAAQTILDDASVSAIRTTLGIDGSSGNIGVNDLENAAIAQLFQARLTPESATPVPITATATASTLYLTPFNGNKLALYNGTRWKLHTLTEISLALSGLTSGKNYDVWVYDNSGTLTLETTVWTNDTTRATSLALQDGVPCKSGTLTRRYVGTFRATSTTQTTDDPKKRFIWNYYNRVDRPIRLNYGGVPWTYTTAAVRQADAETSNKIEFIYGYTGHGTFSATLCTTSANSSAGVKRSAGLGIDATNAFHGACTNVSGAANDHVLHVATLTDYDINNPSYPPGYHYISWNEISEATGTTTWYATDTVFSSTTLIGVQGRLTC